MLGRMARMIPESLGAAPSATPGEARLFRLLQSGLGDETLAWFDVPVRGRHADFVVLDPRRGLLVLEVKDWRLDQVRRMTPSHVTLATPDGGDSLS